jgi:hypothetical protein
MVLALVQTDIRRQADWARAEAKRQTQSAMLTAALAIGGALAALGTIIIGLMALYTWAEIHYGPLVGFAIVGGTTAVIAIALFYLAFMRNGPEPRARPELLLANPTTLKEAIKQDVSHESAVLLETLKQSSLGPAVEAGETALKTGDKYVRAATDHMRYGSRPSLVATLAVAAALGLVLGRRV